MSAKDYPSAPLGTKSVPKLPVRDFSVSVTCCLILIKYTESELAIFKNCCCQTNRIYKLLRHTPSV